MKRILLLLAVLAAPPAVAQPRPSFDCSKASTAVEKLVCSSGELAKADADLAAAYKALAAKLDAKAKDHLVRDETRWIAQRNRECVGTAALMFDCVKYGYPDRIDRLKLYGAGSYPFISTRTLTKAGKVEAVTYSVNIAYPRFDGSSADFGALNKQFADEADKALKENTPEQGSGADRPQEWNYDQDFSLYRPAERAINVQWSWQGYSGGAHPNEMAYSVLVDLKTGKAAGLADIFVEGALPRIVEMVRADLVEQFKKKPGDPEALELPKLAKMLSDPTHFDFRKDKLDVFFNRYDIGAYAVGVYDVELPYARIKALLRPDGPLGALR